MTSIATKFINKNYARLYGFGRKDPSARDPYMTIALEQNRVKYYTSAPCFKNDPELSKMDSMALDDYFSFFCELPSLFTKRCPENNLNSYIIS
ncbi:unnamed protein product [Commensalibacter communis]|uniref:hypothetical protein n=1 Tax=Commensalibacter communis TaxID=2972786 RepID=UPI0022FF9FF3|nr:hypothetical protein [Commensalibacter communis]CAI3927885.1 unnamed protein product [Commensalibacter communis]CAI3931412.1 unnamed protein product [Commensalibacter communis]